MSDNNNSWAKIDVTGNAYFMFNHKPRPADTMFNKPPMFTTELELTEDSTLNVWGERTTYKGLSEVIPALKALKITVGEKTDKDGNVRRNIIKFQSKITEDTTELSRKPKTVDAAGNEMPTTILIGNGSFVSVRGALPDYRKNPVKPGRKPMLPTFDAVQVINLIEYKVPEGSTRGPGGFKVIEGGYTVGSTPSKVVYAESKEEAEDGGDPFEALETPTPEVKPKSVVKRK